LFEYDKSKSDINKKKHGVDFIESQKIWLSDHVIIPTKTVSEENRKAIIGMIDQKFYVTIFTERDGNVRIISCHKADKRWVKIYENYFK